MRNEDWVNHAEDVPEEALKQEAEKEFVNQYRNSDWNYENQRWYKSYKKPILTYIGPIIFGVVALIVFFWPYIKEWVSDLIARIPWFQGMIF